MRSSTGSPALARGFPLSGLRRRAPHGVRTERAKILAMRTLPKANDADGRDDLRIDQTAAHLLVSGDVPLNPSQEQCLGLGTDASSRGVLSHRLAGEA